MRLMYGGKVGIKFTPQQGLAFLAAWYATDTTELSMNPLASAVLCDITDRLAKAYGGPVMVGK